MKDKKGDDIGELVKPDSLKEAEFYTKSAAGVEVAQDRPDRGPLHAVRAPHGFNPRTGRPILRPPKRVIEILKREVDSRAQDCAVVVGTLRALYRNGTITQDQYEIGCSFKTAFDYAGMHGVRACDMERMGSGFSAAGHVSNVQMDAKDYLWQCMQVLGGPGKIQSRALWLIVGLEFSLRDVAGELGRNHVFWSNALVTGLDALVGNVETFYVRGQ